MRPKPYGLGSQYTHYFESNRSLFLERGDGGSLAFSPRDNNFMGLASIGELIHGCALSWNLVEQFATVPSKFRQADERVATGQGKSRQVD